MSVLHVIFTIFRYYYYLFFSKKKTTMTMLLRPLVIFFLFNRYIVTLISTTPKKVYTHHRKKRKRKYTQNHLIWLFLLLFAVIFNRIASSTRSGSIATITAHLLIYIVFHDLWHLFGDWINAGCFLFCCWKKLYEWWLCDLVVILFWKFISKVSIFCFGKLITSFILLLAFLCILRKCFLQYFAL